MTKPKRIHRTVVEVIVTALSDVFERDFYADKVIEYHLKNQKKWGSRDRRFFAESVYDIVRWWRALWFQIGVSESCERADLYLIIGAWMKQKGLELPDWEEFEHLKLRRESESSPAVIESYPDWLYQLAESEIGEDWHSIASSLNRPAEVVLRVNRMKLDRSQLQKCLLEEGVETSFVDLHEDALKLVERKNVFRTESFRRGFFEVQDAVSQCISPLLDVQPGHRVIDGCAGAGGKSLHLATLMKNKGKVIALDIHENKLKQNRIRSTRNGLSCIETRLISGSKVIKRLEGSANRLLLDVPCSGLGVIRRNPDTKWKLTPEKLKELGETQRSILDRYPRMVKPGGKMVYSTCSILPSENDAVVDEFLQKHSEWKIVSRHLWRPDTDGYDGFFAAVFECYE